MKYFIILIVWIAAGLFGALKLHYLDLNQFMRNTIITETEPIHTGQLVLDYLKVSPVKKIATLEVLTEHILVDDYFEDYKVLDFDTPEQLDRFISQMNITWRVKVNAVYGYTADQIAQLQDPIQWWEAKLLYYEVIENNISEVAAGIGISNNALVKRVVNVVLQGIHNNLRKEFESNKEYLEKAKQNAIERFS